MPRAVAIYQGRRQPGSSFLRAVTPLLADGCGAVIATDKHPGESWHGQRVVMVADRDWKDSPNGPDEVGGYKVLGATITIRPGTSQDFIVVKGTEVNSAPSHLSGFEPPLLHLPDSPLGGQSWPRSARATLVVEENSLVTGIGESLALMIPEFNRATGGIFT